MVKARRNDTIRTVVTIIVAAVLIVISIMMYVMVKDVIKDVPAILNNVNTLLSKDVAQILQKVDSFDFAGLNDIIGGFADTVNDFRAVIDLIKIPFGQ